MAARFIIAHQHDHQVSSIRQFFSGSVTLNRSVPTTWHTRQLKTESRYSRRDSNLRLWARFDMARFVSLSLWAIYLTKATFVVMRATAAATAATAWIATTASASFRRYTTTDRYKDVRYASPHSCTHRSHTFGRHAGSNFDIGFFNHHSSLQ